MGVQRADENAGVRREEKACHRLDRGQPVGREALGQLLVLEGGEVEDDDIVVGDVQVVRQLVSAVRPDAAAMPCGDHCVTLAVIASDNRPPDLTPDQYWHDLNRASEFR
jgi:hypothetical protein